MQGVPLSEAANILAVCGKTPVSYQGIALAMP
jgi:hypothetical protein